MIYFIAVLAVSMFLGLLCLGIFDDNWFERTVTILGKTIGYLGGVRPNAPAGSIAAPGEAKDATGTKVVK